MTNGSPGENDNPIPDEKPNGGPPEEENSSEDTGGSASSSSFKISGKGMVGQRIAHYTFIRELGHGGQGFVYLAKDEKLHREVALKVLNNVQSLSPKARLRFVREAETASKLTHPGLCAVHEFGEDNGIPYIAMQYIAGTSLSKRIAMASSNELLGEVSFVEFGDSTTDGHAKSPSPSERTNPSKPKSRSSNSQDSAVKNRKAVLTVVEMIEESARALHAAHEENLVHRDIKPDNIMISASGKPIILDFGLARDDEAIGATLTQDGDMMGTPAYMSPEQITRTALRVDRRTDIYSLGATLYESLTLKRPFKATTCQMLYQKILFDEPKNPRKINPAISEDLRTIIAMSMEKDPGRRYQTAEDFADDLRRLRENKPIEARAAGPVVRATKWIQRNKVVAILSTAVFISLATAAGVFYLKGQEANRALNKAELASQRVQEESNAKSKALQEKTIALTERDLALSDYNRMADIKRLQQAQSDSDELYPPSPKLVSRLVQWQKEHGSLAERLKGHRQFLQALRAQAQPYEESERERDFRHEISILKKLKSLSKRIDDELGTVQDDARRQSLLRQKDSTSEQITDQEQRIRGRRSWNFGKNAELTLQHDIITELVNKLTSFVNSEQGPIKSIKKRIQLSEEIETATLIDHKKDWDDCRMRMSENPRYDGLDMSPQLGLIPLGPDRNSALEEFLVRLTHNGPVPTRNQDGAIPLTEDLGIILILVPGGSFMMGAQAKDPQGQNYDPDIQPGIESPVHEMQLSPYFLSKYEMTQVQWLRTFGNNPSGYPAGAFKNRKNPPAIITALNPVESVSWLDVRKLLPRVNLCIPSEAEWEMAARAGDYMLWSGAGTVEEIRKIGNIGGRELARIGFVNRDPNHEDPFSLHAPVGSFAANKFGFHDMTGNVWEWTLDGDFGYSRKPIPRGLRGTPESSNRRIYRGGAFFDKAQGSRITLRNAEVPSMRKDKIGIRPAMMIQAP